MIFEIWLDPEPDGHMLPGLCIAGPMGDDYRSLLNSGAVKAGEIEGHSHFEVMTRYWHLQGWGEYRTEHSQDHEPFRDEWAVVQRGRLDRL
ncbi:hypothetical protein EV128_13462 [Rhizobium azibense]|nr:hypothetical protein EV128_13462 [Rhizobium azibense]